MIRRLTSLVAAGLVGLVACRRGDALTAADSSFVAAMVEFRRIPADPAGTGPARDSILRRRRLTVAALERSAGVLAADPERAAAVWREIEKRAAATPAIVAPVPALTPKLPPATPRGTARKARERTR